ncbi:MULTISPECIES: TVP38/TMEM64 family protein [Natronomonas]|uniref:TVP38/TMEM64 family protein n=1 Tax=Natronomonas salsuginis TaxID=2217661 RepID=A0A4U5JCJ1_9EURY|nr:TVP38/TMEM64 family protein [Natronomonas salsuginis]
MRVFSSRRARWRGILASVLVVAVFAVVYVSIRRFAPFIFDTQALRTWIAQFGIFAPLVFIAIQAAQVVIAPLPGQILALIAGYLFGSVAGTVYSLVGVLIGSVIAFSLAKRYGRPFVEDILHEDVITRFDEFVDTVGLPGLIAFVIIPGLPDDAVCFLSGLTKWRLRTFISVIAIGRLPAYVLTVYAGGEFASGRFLSGLLLVGIVVGFSVVGYYKQEAIRDVIQRLDLTFRSG